jgi:peptide chain release factor subunit 1
MVSQDELNELLRLEGSTDSRILSLYLNVDQTYAANLNRGFDTALKNLISQYEAALADPHRIRRFGEDLNRVMEFMRNYSPKKKSLVLFCDASRDFLWHRHVHVRLENRIYWEKRPYVRPLIEARDEFERYGLILTDRAHARLFTITLNEIEEHKEAFAEADVRRFDGPGTDHLRSQMTLQRNADEHARWHLKNVADIMERLVDGQQFGRLILAGPIEPVTELERLLSQRLQKRVIGKLAIALEAKEQEILEDTREFVVQRERQDENETVARLITAAAKHRQAVTGLPATIEAAVEGRILSLVYSDDFAEDGSEWLAGKSTYDAIQELSEERASAEVTSSGDLLEWLVAQVARQGGVVEQVKDEAADSLKRKGRGIGAFLRF